MADDKIPPRIIAEQHEAYRRWCPVCGNDHKPYKTHAAWWKHLREEHPKTFNDMAAKILRALKDRDDEQ